MGKWTNNVQLRSLYIVSLSTYGLNLECPKLFFKVSMCSLQGGGQPEQQRQAIQCHTLLSLTHYSNRLECRALHNILLLLARSMHTTRQEKCSGLTCLHITAGHMITIDHIITAMCALSHAPHIPFP